ncbi:MAG: tRNA adenosine(34) deaminase TadA [Planctomycetota bacterium]
MSGGAGRWRTVVARLLGRTPEPAPGILDSEAAGELDRRMMARAIELAARAAAEGEVPVGAVVYRGEEIVAEGWNRREATGDPVGHAELLAMSEAGRRLGRWRLHDCSLAVTLEPCPMCAGAMVNARLRRVVYGADDPKAGACRTLYAIATDPRLNHRVEVIAGVEAAACGGLLSGFFRRRRAERKTARTAVSDDSAGDAATTPGGG